MTVRDHAPELLGSTGGQHSRTDDISLFAIGALLVRHRWRIARWAVAGALIVGVPVLLRGRLWTSSAAFIPQGGDSGQGGLQSLAGQFGIALPGGGSSQSPDFYVELLTSRSILGPIAADTIPVAEEGGRRRAVLDLLDIGDGTPAQRQAAGVAVLRDMVKPAISRSTGVVTVTVRTHWASVSYALTDRIVKAVNRFNLLTRQSQAGEERRFAEARLDAQRQTLAVAEARLSGFLRANRQYTNSPDLAFEHDRLEREVSLQQQLLVRLAQSAEEARLREVRDVPVVTVIEPPSLPVRPDRRGALSIGLVGLVAGTLVGVLVAFLREGFARRRAAGDEEAARFAAVLADMRAGLRRRLPWRGASAQNAAEGDGTLTRP